jgi:hypothetical protein
MKGNTLLAIAFAPLLMTSTSVLAAVGTADEELPLHTQRLSNRIFLAWVGDYMQSMRVVAFATTRGIVVIDSHLAPSKMVRVRQAIKNEFVRKGIGIKEVPR